MTIDPELIRALAAQDQEEPTALTRADLWKLALLSAVGLLIWSAFAAIVYIELRSDF